MGKDWPGDATPEPRSFRLLCVYLWRALCLRCPVCGRSPIFVPLRRTRSLMDWFTPLDGCPRCGYPFEREVGYFLFAVFVLNYGVAVSVSIAVYVVLEYYVQASTPVLLIGSCLPAPIVAMLIARQAKAIFLAIDHFFDPFIREPIGDDDSGRGGDDGDLRLDRPPSGGGGPAHHLHEPGDGLTPAPPAEMAGSRRD